MVVSLIAIKKLQMLNWKSSSPGWVGKSIGKVPTKVSAKVDGRNSFLLSSECVQCGNAKNVKKNIWDL